MQFNFIVDDAAEKESKQIVLKMLWCQMQINVINISFNLIDIW